MFDPKKIRVVFMGTSEFAAEILSSLANEGYDIVSVYTKPERRAGRKHETNENEIRILAQEKKVSVESPEKFGPTEIDKLKKLDPDLLIVCYYGKILPLEVLKIAKFGSINVHPSLLPKFRGPSPIRSAIREGEIETGTTIMLMADKIDVGDILSQKMIAIPENIRCPELTAKLARLSAELLLETIPQWLNGNIEPKKQVDSEATYSKLTDKTDGRIDWSKNAAYIYNSYRAFYPWPGVFTFWNRKGRKLRLKLSEISLSSNGSGNREFGSVFFEEDRLKVQAKDGSIVIRKIQLEGKPEMPVENFLNGYRDIVGSRLE